MILTTNNFDHAVSPATVGDIVAAWQDKDADASIYAWPDEMELEHNMIDDDVRPLPAAVDFTNQKDHPVRLE